MKKIVVLIIIALMLNSCSITEFKIEEIPNSSIGSAGQRVEYFDVIGSDGLNNKQLIEKLKEHNIQSLNIDSARAGVYFFRIYYKHSSFSSYDTSLGSNFDKNGERDLDSPDLFGKQDRRIGLVLFSETGAEFVSYIDTTNNTIIDSTFLEKLIKFHSKK